MQKKIISIALDFCNSSRSTGGETGWIIRTTETTRTIRTTKTIRTRMIRTETIKTTRMTRTDN
jgi:hypothetical protein